MRSLKVVLIFALLLFFSPATASEIDYEIHPGWYMVTCAGFGYQLEFDNYDGTFRLRYGDECTTIVRPVFKGRFKIEKQSVLLDFGEIKAYYYLKLPYSEACGGEGLTKAEQKLFCDESQLLRGKDVLPPGSNNNQVYLKKPALFPLKIEGNKKGEMIEALLRDLRTHCFVQIEEE